MEQGWGDTTPVAVPEGAVRPSPSDELSPNNGDRPDDSSNGWTSVDTQSGPMTADDWSHPTGQFPSSGAWKQT
jgi:hypothetical protein